MARQFHKQWLGFDCNGFSRVATKNLELLELKERSNQIVKAMELYLPSDFKTAAKMILNSLSPLDDGNIYSATVDKNGIAGWAIMPISHYVGLHGHHDFDISMNLFKEMTKRFSSEFGIRFFLIESPDKTLATLKQWTLSDNQHVRRLVSEGTRPRLPWAMQLPQFIKEPSPVISLLESLKDDSEEYVRRSVANNLNDIAKDHGDLVADIAVKWLNDASEQRKKLIKHACRTLIKNGNKKVLRGFGYKPPKINKTKVKIITAEVEFGSALEFSLSLSSDLKQDQLLMIDYIIHHQKCNGKTSAKVFKWCSKSLLGNSQLSISKKHMIKKITTRVYYPGVHALEIMVNGVSLGRHEFNLLM